MSRTTLPRYELWRQPPAARADLALDTLIGGRYVIEGKLGVGGMGTIYRARHAVLQRPVAIKILHDAAGDVDRRRFQREARAASRVDHPNVVGIIDFGRLLDGRPYLVMELLEGQTLDEVMSQGPVPADRACRIAAQIARGLQAVHDCSIIHRDLKPTNVFLLQRDDQPDFVKIVDFGIAKMLPSPPLDSFGLSPPPGTPGVLEADIRGTLTQTGMVIGTPEYMSPEQALDAKLDHRVDQYALGCMMYEMLTGELPFVQGDANALMLAHVSEAVQPLRARCPDLHIPAHVEAVVLRLLSKLPDERFSSMRAVEQELLAGPVPGAGPQLAGPVPGAGPQLPKTRLSLRALLRTRVLPLQRTRLSPGPRAATEIVARLRRRPLRLLRRFMWRAGLLLLLLLLIAGAAAEPPSREGRLLFGPHARDEMDRRRVVDCRVDEALPRQRREDQRPDPRAGAPTHRRTGLW